MGSITEMLPEFKDLGAELLGISVDAVFGVTRRSAGIGSYISRS